MSVAVDPELRDRVLVAYLDRLRASGNMIATDERARRGAVAQAHSVLDDLDAGLIDLPSPATLAASLDVGSERAVQGIHPVESIRAAGELFEVALPLLLASLGDRPDVETQIEVSVMLNRAITNRIASGSVRYVGFLLGQLQDSHVGERQRVARELHDQTAHSIAVAMSALELHHTLLDRDPVRAAAKYEQTQEAMRSALADVRRFALELRTAVEPATFETTIKDYIESTAGPDLEWTVTISGDPCLLPREICQEMYVAVREAIRNALVHADTDELTVVLDIGETGVTARVDDSGRGFVVGGARRTASMGLYSMQERARLLGGQMEVRSSPGDGTSVTISVPLGRVAL